MTPAEGEAVRYWLPLVAEAREHPLAAVAELEKWRRSAEGGRAENRMERRRRLSDERLRRAEERDREQQDALASCREA